MQDSIIISVLESLIGSKPDESTQYINDDTIEGAITLMNKIGYLIDEKIEKMNKENSDPKTKEEKKAKNEKTIKEFTDIYKKFEDIGYDNNEKFPDISLRVKILIKNMLDNKLGGW